MGVGYMRFISGALSEGFKNQSTDFAYSVHLLKLPPFLDWAKSTDFLPC